MNKEMIIRNPLWESTFNKVAKTYSSVGPQYFNYFGQKLVDNSDIHEGDYVLDVAIGRGASLFPAANKVGPSGKAIGIDFCDGMIKETQNEIIKLNISNINVFQMDAEQINFEDEYFNCVICGLAIHFFTNYKRALSEFYRVLKPDGTVGISMWKKKGTSDWAIGKVLDKVVSKYLPPQFTNNRPNPNPARPEFGDEKVLSKVLVDAGFKDIQILHEHKMFYFKDCEEWWQEQWSHAGRTTFEFIKMRSNDLLNRFKNELFEEFKKEFGADGIPLEGDVLLAYGLKK